VSTVGDLAEAVARYVMAERALVNAHRDLYWYSYYSGVHAMALAQNKVLGFNEEWYEQQRKKLDEGGE
jgi:hypothetical protein